MYATYAGMPSYNGFNQALLYGGAPQFYPQWFNECFMQPLQAGYPSYPPNAYTLPPAVKEEVVTTSYQPPAPLRPLTHSQKSLMARMKVVVGTLCAICNDIASGYHFGAASCAGCRIFFRRNVLSGDSERLRCHYEGNCEVSKDVRTACRHCRFNKCLLAGMDIMAIQGSRDRRSSTGTSAANTSSSPVTSPYNTSNRRKVPEGTPCAICSDVATGYHYGVAACFGCKTFFRRTVVAGHTYICQHGGTCVVNKDQRMACRHCRLNKCIQAGMHPDALKGSRDRRGPYKKDALDTAQQSLQPSMPSSHQVPVPFADVALADHA
ncbi:Protein NHR-1 d [Aphelenchoides avenae]|nr:Protein NHR-1 d [Aphelenchus avenae]